MITLYHVKFLSPFHVGNRIGSIDYTDSTIHSDTLASAIIDTAYALFDDVQSLVEQLRVSSVFYCVQKGREIVYTVPSPFILPDQAMAKDVSELKKIKKRSFITLDELDLWLKGSLTPEILGEDLNLYTSDVRISAVMDRQTGAASPYTRSAIHVYPSVLGYFLAECQEKNVPVLDAALNLLAYRGLGGDKSSGFGQIEIQKQPVIPARFQTKTGNRHYTLSLFNPTETEINKVTSRCSYKLEKRSYWFKEGTLTRRYTFFREGSLFDFEPIGQDITLENPSKKMIKGKPFYLGVQ